jgi:tRNA A-37 threonylcarbamoyl transferase component Bud32
LIQPADHTPADECRLGPYRLLSSLGRGATAQVFKAEHRHLGQLRALKILLPEHATRPDLVGRLVTEARAMARLRHPCIAEVFECDVLKDGSAFIAMEYLRGEPMRSWMERVGKLNRHPLLAAAIVGMVAEGLSFAHDQAVVHRDLKPENVLLIPHPSKANTFSVKLLDFGIAKILQEEPLTRTRTGCVVGTPGYMAPEQWCAGSAIDHRADLYALGCMLFELLSGRPPFLETSDLSLMRAHLDDLAPVVGSLVENVPAALDRLVQRLLAKSPTERPQDAEEVIAAIESVVGCTRAQFSDLLHSPGGYGVVARESAEIEPRDIVRTLIATGHSAELGLLLALRPGGKLRRLRRRLPVLIGVACCCAAGLAAVWFLAQGPATQPPLPAARKSIIAKPPPLRESSPEPIPSKTPRSATRIAGATAAKAPRIDKPPSRSSAPRRDRAHRRPVGPKRQAKTGPRSPTIYRPVGD